MNYSGFQLGHPNATLPLKSKNTSAFCEYIWMGAQRIIALGALLALSPILLAMWLSVRTTSPGKFLFTQDRPGLNGAPIKVFKVRTMRTGSEAGTRLGVSHSDSRVTAIGKLLRTLKLDELPQLWNIANGDMNFVGPRPIPNALNDELTRRIPGFTKRYQVKPGLTSLGQICVKDNALGDALVEDWALRFQGEIHYINNRNFRYDLLIISMTAIYVFKSLLQR